MNLRRRPKAGTPEEHARFAALRKLRDRRMARHQGEQRPRHEPLKEQIWYGDE